MTLSKPSEVREVSGIDSDSLKLMRAYIQGAVYCWIKNETGKWFAVRDLVGGKNTDWSNTPLQILYTRHIDNDLDDEEAFEAAAKDVGWIVKSVLNDDQRMFERDDAGYVNRYRWLEEQ